ncbi:hypothetical protein MBLNU459_g1692t1 [Dothideomycetes sp. NU459]
MAETVLAAASTLYFGYGSNLWLHQMAQRCPSSTYLGIARLDGYRWMINSRGYANVVQVSNSTTSTTATTTTTTTSTASSSSSSSSSSSPDNKVDYSSVVYGLVYALPPADEAALDRNEGVPVAYNKEMLDVRFWPRQHPSHGKVSTASSSAPSRLDAAQHGGGGGGTERMLVYIDRNRTEDAAPKREYVYRMNMGIRDAVREGVPEEYVESVMRTFIPDVETEGMRSVAERQAVEFRDER